MIDEMVHKIDEIAKGLIEHPGSYVFVIGAGASASAGVPVSSELKKEFTRGFCEEIKKRLDDERIKRHEPKYETLDEVAMEVLLPVYAEIVGGENPIERFLKGHLKEIGEKEKFPPLGYEILAHLVNLGLVNHVVSMNFDELLEAALDEEVGEQDYIKVRSKPQFVKLLDDEESGKEDEKICARTLLLKPHGTISLSATLKVELDEVFEFEKEKLKVLEKVFRRKNVVFVGYCFLDPDLRKLIWPLFNSRELEKVYFVDIDEKVYRNNKTIHEMLSCQAQRGRGEGFICCKSDTFFKELGHAIEKTEGGQYLPKVTRHIMRSLIFREEFDPNLENKLLIEILIFSLKVQGKFKTKALLSCERIKYLSKKLTKKRKTAPSTSVYTVLQKLENEQIMEIRRGEKN